MLLGAPAFLFKQLCCLVGFKFSLCVVLVIQLRGLTHTRPELQPQTLHPLFICTQHEVHTGGRVKLFQDRKVRTMLWPGQVTEFLEHT